VKMFTSLDSYDGAGRMVVEMHEGLKSATEDTTDATDDADVATKDFTAALQANADATNEARDARRSAADATFALHEAEKKLSESLSTVTDRLNEADGNLLEQRSILEGVAQDAIAVADAQVRIAQETATAGGAVLTAKQQSDLFRSSLQSQADQLSGPSRQAVLDYIATLNAIPRNITTRANLDTGGVFRHARGTSSAPGGLALVGEEGPELVAMPRGAQVFPAGQTAAMLNGTGSGSAMGAAGAAGGPVYQITVNAGLGANGKEIGDVIINEIKKAERRRGPGWRT
jgi:hypothetical protein